MIKLNLHFKTLIVLFILTLSSLLHAQTTTVTVGTGSTSNTNYPVSISNYNSRWEGLYLNSEIGRTGTISTLRFFESSIGNQAVDNIKVYIKKTTATTLSTGTFSVTGYTLVYSGSIALLNASGWATINLNTPFVCCGTENLEIAIERSSTSKTANAAQFSYSVAKSNLCRFANSDTQLPTTLTATTNRPNIQLDIQATPVGVTQNASLCKGSSTQLSIPTATTYAWSPSTGLSATNISNPVASPTISTTYSISSTNSFGCVSTSAYEVNVKPLPSFTLSNVNTQTCLGADATISNSCTDGSSFVWSNSMTTPSIVITPTQTTTYTVTASLSGCTSTNKIVVTIKPLPSYTLSSNSPVCQGQSATITSTSTDGSSYVWSTGAAGSKLTTVVAQTTTYTVTATLSTCTSTNSIVVYTKPKPDFTISSNSPICLGQTASIKANSIDGSTYNWSNSLTGAQISTVPTRTTTYTVTASLSGCTSTSNVTVDVKALPSFTLSSNSPVCPGQNANLTATTTNSSTFVWSNSMTTPSIVVAPTQTTTYIVTASLSGCTSTNNIVVTIKPLPSYTLSSNSPVCPGQSATITATSTDGSTYVWNTGVKAAKLTTAVAQTTTYTVTATLSTCTSTNSIVVTTKPKPAFTLSSNSPICLGQSAIINANSTDGSTYTWSNALTGSKITAAPTRTTTYTVTASLSGCTSTSNVAIVVNAMPSFTISSTAAVCPGSSVKITATTTNNSTFVWDNGTVGNQVTVTPQVQSTTYTVTASLLGCTSTKAFVLTTTKPAPTYTLSYTPICAGQTTTISATSKDGSTYVWNTGVKGNQITATPTQTTTYTITATLTGCSNTNSVIVSFKPQPSFTLSSNSPICLGQSATINANSKDASTYSWSNSTTGSQINVTPTRNASYTVTATLSGCTSTSNINVEVKALPSYSLSSNSPVCLGQSAVLVANTPNNSTFAWSNGSLNPKTSVVPTATTTYTVTASLSGCTGTSNIVVDVKPLPTATIISSTGSTTFTAGKSITLTSNDAGTYLWSTGATTNSINVSKSGDYAVTVSNNGCTNSTKVTCDERKSLYVEVDKLCSSATDDTYNLIANTYGGLAPYTYTWTLTNTIKDSTIVVPIDFSNITYTGNTAVVLSRTKLLKYKSNVDMTVTDAEGSVVDVKITIGSSAGNLLQRTDFMQINPYCGIPYLGKNGSIYFLTVKDSTGNQTSTGGLSGGCPPYTFKWYNSNGVEMPETSNNLRTATDGNYRLITMDANGCKDTTKWFTIPVNCGIRGGGTPIQIGSNINNVAKAVLYPNPATTEGVTVNMGTDNVKTRISISDMNGNIIYSAETSENTIQLPLTNVNNGLYIVKIEQEGEMTFQKLNVMK